MKGAGIVQLLERWGLKGPELFLVALGISSFILIASYLLATSKLRQKKGRS
jgi:hypothetical protein